MDQEAIFDVGKFDEKDVDLDRAPESAEQYLKQVHVQRKKVENVAIATTKPAPKSTQSKLKHLASNSESQPSGSHLAPSEWQKMQLSNFSDLRLQLSANRAAVRAEPNKNSKNSDPVEIPSVDDDSWEVFSGRTLNETSTDYLLPSPKLVLRFSTPVILQLLTDHVENFTSAGYSPARLHWLFALLSILDKPLEPGTCANIRELARYCSNCRRALDIDRDIVRIREFSLIILIVARYFGQMDLADPM